MRSSAMLLLVFAGFIVVYPSVTKSVSSEPLASGVSFSPYYKYRADYNLLPVHVVGVRGGGPKPEDSFKVEATRLKNETEKSVTMVGLTWYLFDANDWNVCLASGQTDLTKIDLKPFAVADFVLFVVYVNEIPLFKTNPEPNFHLEVAVTEVQYEDGSTWQATDLPKQFDPTKLPKKN